MTTHENIAWPQLLSNPIVTAQHDNAGNRIAAATETFQRTVSEMVQALNDRAWLLANSAQFNAALRDVAAIRTILPRSGLGYVATRGVYCQQGRYAAAVAMYDQGLKAVPESDPYYQHLQQHRLTAININNKRVDFISRLPLDIVITNIVPRMEHRCYSDLPSEYLYVSHAWQERFLQQPNGLDFHFGTEEDTFKTGHFQLARFAPYVQKLLGVISGHAELKDLFSRGHFSNLKKLVLYCEYGGGVY